MEIFSPNILSPLLTSKIESLDLKLNQQIEVKIISSKTESQTLVLLISQSNKSIEVQSNQPIETKAGQTLQLVVTKATPVAEFKILENQAELTLTDSNKSQNSEKNTLIKELLLKQIIPDIENKKNTAEIKTTPNSTPTIISAKILSVNEQTVQVKLDTTPTQENTEYTKNLKQNVLQQQNPIVTLKKTHLSTINTKPILIDSTKPSVETQDLKPGQSIQLEVNRKGLNPEFKIINQTKLNLAQGQVYTAKVIHIKDNNIQLRLVKNEISDTNLKPSQRNPLSLDKPSLLITITPKQLSFPLETASQTETNNPPITAFTKSLRPEQKIILEANKTGSLPEFKIIEFNQPKVNPGQIISAKIIDINKNTVQLQLENIPQMNNASSKLSATSETKPALNSSVISLQKNQLTSSLTDLNSSSIKNNPTLQINTLKQGQQITLEVVKTANQTEYKLIDNKQNLEQTILETIKQVLPIQEPPTELLNQIINNLAIINKNEKIPDTLKRLAREILESLPQIKNLDNPKELKRAISQSGQFLEAKLVQYADREGIELKNDFKNQLLKLQQGIKQELEITKEQKTQSNDFNLIKEMQQKTENTLAKIILNQLTSLPKEEGTRQVWIVDLPFINKDVADSVKIEIDREQHTGQEQQKQNWSVNITVTPPGLATIDCKISCFDKTINTRFWSDQQETVSKISQNLDFLKSQFESVGINPGHLSAHSGKPSNESHTKITDQSLFDQEV